MTVWGPAPAGADDGGGCRNSSNLSWVRACDLWCLSNVSVNLSHYLVAFLGASFRLPTRATAPTWVAPSERFTVWGSIYGTTGDSGERWPLAPLAVPQSGRRTFDNTRPHMPRSACPQKPMDVKP